MVLALFTNAQAELKEEENREILFTLRLPPVRELSDKLMTVARAVAPGPQTEMLPLLGLGPYGYPNFAGVSETEGVTAFVLQAGENAEMPLVLLMKIETESPMLQTVMQQGWGYEQRDEWTLLSPNPAHLALVENVSSWIEIAQSPKTYDVEMTFELDEPRVNAWMDTIKSVFSNPMMLMLYPGLTAERIEEVTEELTQLASVLEDFETFTWGLNLSAKEIAMGGTVLAKAGTAEAAVLSSPAGGESELANLFTAEHAFMMSSKVDSKAWNTYLKSISEELKSLNSKSDDANLTSDIFELLLDFTKDFDGTAVGCLDFDATTQKEVGLSVYGGDFKNERVVEMYEKLNGDWYAALLKKMGLDAEEIGLQIGFQSDVAQHGDVSIHKTSSKATAGAKEDEEEENVQSEAFLNERYLAVAEGNLLTTNSVEKIKDVIDLVGKGEAVDTSIGAAMPLSKGQAMKFQMDLKAIVAGVLAVESEEALPPSLLLVLKELLETELESLVGGLDYKERQMWMYMKVPVETVAKLSNVQRAFKQAEAEQAINVDAGH